LNSIKLKDGLQLILLPEVSTPRILQEKMAIKLVELEDGVGHLSKCKSTLLSQLLQLFGVVVEMLNS
jgi:hypothetical protein